jgi:acyl carrier protein phosphodiesterase
MADLTPARLQAMQELVEQCDWNHVAELWACARDVLGAYTTLRSRLQVLEQEWRAHAQRREVSANPMAWPEAGALKDCADQLAALLAADAPPPEAE